MKILNINEINQIAGGGLGELTFFMSAVALSLGIHNYWKNEQIEYFCEENTWNIIYHDVQLANLPGFREAAELYRWEALDAVHAIWN